MQIKYLITFLIKNAKLQTKNNIFCITTSTLNTSQDTTKNIKISQTLKTKKCYKIQSNSKLLNLKALSTQNSTFSQKKKKKLKNLYLPITRQILDWSKLKQPAEDNFKFDENIRKLSKWVENTVGKGEIACYEQFFPFPIVFSKGLFPKGVKRCYCMGMG